MHDKYDLFCCSDDPDAEEDIGSLPGQKRLVEGRPIAKATPLNCVGSVIADNVGLYVWVNVKMVWGYLVLEPDPQPD